MKRIHQIATACTVVVMIAGASLLSPTLAVDGGPWSDQYDHHFRKQAKRYFGVGFDWRWFKAQGIVESGLRARAESARGAVGIMQLLPSTFAEVFDGAALTPGIFEPRWNIAAGIAYDRHLYERWRGRVEDEERFIFTLASYNAGFNGITHALNQAGSAPQWRQVAPHAPAETRGYVEKIVDLMDGAG